MNRQLIVLFLVTSINLFGCEKSTIHSATTNDKTQQDVLLKRLVKASQIDIDKIAETLNVKYKVLTNIPSDKCDINIADGNCFEVELS
ncbi:MAG: hexosaminidase, partial [Alteromonadaceae bacterium]